MEVEKFPSDRKGGPNDPNRHCEAPTRFHSLHCLHVSTPVRDFPWLRVWKYKCCPVGFHVIIRAGNQARNCCCQSVRTPVPAACNLQPEPAAKKPKVMQGMETRGGK